MNKDLFITLFLFLALFGIVGANAQVPLAAPQTSIDTLAAGVATAEVDTLNTSHVISSFTFNTTDMEGIIAVVGFFSCIILVVFFVQRSKMRREKERYNLINHAIDTGREIPVELLDIKPNYYAKGIKNIAIGLGLALLIFTVMDELTFTPVGLIFVLLGIAQLLIYFRDKKEQENKELQKAKNLKFEPIVPKEEQEVKTIDEGK